jgi:hypothetical protein
MWLFSHRMLQLMVQYMCERNFVFWSITMYNKYMVFIVIYIMLKLQEDTVTYMFCYNLMSTCVVWGKVTAVGVLKHNFQ